MVCRFQGAKQNKNICEVHAWAFGSATSGSLPARLLCIGTKTLASVLTSKLKECLLFSFPMRMVLLGSPCCWSHLRK